MKDYIKRWRLDVICGGPILWALIWSVVLHDHSLGHKRSVLGPRAVAAAPVRSGVDAGPESLVAVGLRSYEIKALVDLAESLQSITRISPEVLDGVLAMVEAARKATAPPVSMGEAAGKEGEWVFAPRGPSSGSASDPRSLVDPPFSNEPAP